MRKHAITQSSSGYRRVMLFDPEDGSGVYLFLFTQFGDSSCVADEWHESATLAECRAATAFGITPQDWQPLADPRPGEPHDRV